MQINRVSFGKIVEVHAPHHDAVRIASAVNGADCVKPEVKEYAQKIFDDTENGHALAFSFDEYPKKEPEVCYIFSGKETKEYLHHLFNKAMTIRDIKRSHSPENALPKVMNVKREFNKKIRDMINRSQENFALKIAPNGESVETENILHS